MSKFIWNGKEYDSRYDLLDDAMSEEDFDAVIDDIYDEVKIGGLTFDPSRVLKELDPIAYKEFRSEYVDSLGQDYTDSDMPDVVQGAVYIDDDEGEEEDERWTSRRTFPLRPIA